MLRRTSDGAIVRNGDHICSVDGQHRAILKSGLMRGLFRKKFILVSYENGTGNMEKSDLATFGLEEVLASKSSRK